MWVSVGGRGRAQCVQCLNTPQVPFPSSSLHSNISSLYNLSFGQVTHVSVQLFHPVLLTTKRQVAGNSEQPLKFLFGLVNKTKAIEL